MFFREFTYWRVVAESDNGGPQRLKPCPDPSKTWRSCMG